MAFQSRPFGKSVRLCVALAALIGLLITNVMPSFAAGGQTGNLQGLVVDGATRAPVVGAAITAASPSGRYSARSDAQGRFAIIGLTVDTYSVSITQPGYETFTLSGVNVVGDNTVNLPAEPLQKSLQTIGRTRARTAGSAYQPTQTVDSVSVSGDRALVALGKAGNTSQNQLALSVPGVQLTNNQRLTIRGGLSTEVGYQLDGIDFTEPFLFQNASNGISVGAGSLQVVEGSGDATQGNVGGGVVNSVLKRGSRPPFGLVDFEIGAPNYGHQAGVEYGWATPDGRIANYTAYYGQRYVPYYGPASTNAADTKNYNGFSSAATDDFVDNFVYRFGKSNNQSLQVAYLNHNLQYWGDLSGTAGRLQQAYNPYNLVNVGTAFDSTLPEGDPNSVAFLTARYGLVPFATASSATQTTPEQTQNNPTRYLKFEYTNSLNATTFLDLSTANVNQIQATPTNYNLGIGRRYDETGGQNTTVKLELTHQFNDKLTSTIGFNLDNKHPIWNEADPYSAASSLAGNGGSATLPTLDDYALPANINAPVSATNPCPATSANGCYVYSQTGYTGRLPMFGINYQGTDNQEYGIYLRNQIQPTSRVHLDLGVRFDGLNWKQGPNPFNTQPGALSNPNDVETGLGPGGTPNFLRDSVVHPRIAEPRLAAAFQITKSDSIRAGYGRSVIFPNAQSLGTPAYISGLPASVLNLAPLPGTNTADPSTWTCGSGQNAQWATTTDSKNYVGPGAYWRCKNYGQQTFWMLDQQHDAPDVGNNESQTTSNTDLTYQHQFKNGMALKFTSYYKREFAVPGFALISQVLNSQGVPISQVFGVSSVGINKTSGVEFGLQTAERRTGFSGYVSATYTNVIDSVPPLVFEEDQLPLIPSESLVLGDTYRAGYVSPFVVNLGVQFKTRSGFRINPVLSYDRGFPIGVGNLVASTNPLTGSPANLPQSNLNNTALSGYGGITGAFNATNYVDPVNPGTIINPNIAATRGTPETSATGGILSRPRLYTNITFEYTRGRSTYGLLVANLFGNPYGEPVPNPYYQPIATGIAGPSTGQTAAAFPGSVPYLYGGFRNIPSYIYGKSAYVLPIGTSVEQVDAQRPLTLRAYYQLSL